MISRINITTVPARGEEDVGTDTASTGLVGECDGIERSGTGMGPGRIASEVGIPATMSESISFSAASWGALGADHGVSDDHTEALLKMSSSFNSFLSESVPWGRM